MNHPGALAVAIVLLLALRLVLRAQRPTANQLIRLLAGIAAAALLTWAGTPAAHLLLALLGLVAAGGIGLASYAHRPRSLSPGRAALCAALRGIAVALLLVIVARPSWRSVERDYEKPLIVALLDQSDSLNIIDRTAQPAADDSDPQAAPAASRAARFAAAAGAHRDQLRAIDRLFEVQHIGFGETLRTVPSWAIHPGDPATDLAGALAQALARHAVNGDPPALVICVSDGADSGDDPTPALAAASAAAERRLPLVTVGVGPAPGETPRLAIARLEAPERVGPRQRVPVSLTAEVANAPGARLEIGWRWNAGEPDLRSHAVVGRQASIEETFETDPPGPGVHRLTVSARLIDSVDDLAAERALVIEVRAESIRVLLLDQAPTPEFAFIGRTLQADSRFEVTRAFAAQDGPPIEWERYDVVLLGGLEPGRWPAGAPAQLAEAVRARGVGLGLLGGRTFFNLGGYTASPLAEISPVSFTLRRTADDERATITPLESTDRHPLWVGVAADLPPDIWESLPALGIAARLGEPRPLATVLARDPERRPLLAAHDVGRGRALAAAWAQTWPWALRSDDGHTLHARFWRQAVNWLANRRPQAWVLSDQARYTRTTLDSGRRTIRISAGVGGAAVIPAEVEAWDVSLVLRRATDPSTTATRPTTQPATPADAWPLPLRASGDAEWVADIGRASGLAGFPQAGAWTLEFTARPRVAAGAALPPEWRELTARNGFVIEHIDRERQPPTSDLPLLARIAEATAPFGGRYVPLDEVGQFWAQLATDDRRRPVERAVDRSPTADRPWWIYIAVLTTLAVEWSLRRRAGLS